MSLDADPRQPGWVTFTGASTVPADQGAPFSGEQKVTITLAGSTTIFVSPGTTTRVWRDAQGRTRMEEPNSPMVQMCDPIEGACYVLDSRDMIAHRMKYMPKDVTTVDPSNGRDAKRRLEGLWISGESFETRTIQGVEAKGYRFQVALLHESREVWFAPALGIVIRSEVTHGGKELTEMVKLRLENPPQELFNVPSGYKVRDETGPFTIALGPGTPR